MKLTTHLPLVPKRGDQLKKHRGNFTFTFFMLHYWHRLSRSTPCTIVRSFRHRDRWFESL